MVNTDTIRFIVGVIGNVTSFFLFASPMPTFYKIIKKRDVEEFSPIPYLAALLNCALWVFYGLPIVHPNSTLVITINGLGLFLEFCYLIIFLMFSTNKQRLKVCVIFFIQAVAFGGIATVTLTAFHTHDSRSMFVGILCVIFGVCMYASPLSILRLVIKTKSVKYMPFFLSLASFLNGVIWVIYALLRFDPYIMTGNGLGALFGTIQLLVYAFYYFRPSPIEKGTTIEMGNSDGKKPPLQ